MRRPSDLLNGCASGPKIYLLRAFANQNVYLSIDVPLYFVNGIPAALKNNGCQRHLQK